MDTIELPYTPGRWMQEEEARNERTVGTVVADCGGHMVVSDYDGDQDFGEHDCRLIASSRDLLSALHESTLHLIEEREGIHESVSTLHTGDIPNPEDREWLASYDCVIALNRVVLNAAGHPAYQDTEERCLDPTGTAILDIRTERTRQIREEGYDHAHDAGNTPAELAGAAAAYAALLAETPASEIPKRLWPARWAPSLFKPKDTRRNLVRAGALLVAAIERLDAREAEERS